MKNPFVLIFASTLFFFSQLASAQAPQAPVQLSPDVKQGIELLAKSFGLESEKPVTPEIDLKRSQKTTADVADKAINKVEEAVMYMEKHIKSVAPEVWRIMVRQQYGQAIGNLMFSLGWIIAAVVAHLFLNHAWGETTQHSKSDSEAYFFLVGVCPAVVGLIAFIFFMANMGESIKLLFNPEYYAVKDLIRVVLAR